MSAEQLIALETTLGELGNLYVVAKRFRSLRAEADTDLMPSLSRVGSTLRGLLRRGELTEARVASAASEIARLRERWEMRLETVHEGPAYQAALKAWEDGDGPLLRRALPAMFADAKLVEPPPLIFLAVSAARGRRRAGAHPFLTATECADRIASYLSDGIPSEASGEEWWNRELTTIGAMDDPGALDTPIAIRIDAHDLALPVFQIEPSPVYHLFCRTLQVPFSIVLQAEVDDEWWQTYQEYGVYRDALADQLRQRAIAVDVALD